MRDYQSIKQRAKEHRRKVSDFLVLSDVADPFYAGRPTPTKKAEWFAALYEKRGWGDRVHSIRGFHYALRTIPEAMLDGSMYDFTNKDHYKELGKAIRFARLLGLIEDDMVVEEQYEPRVYYAPRIGDPSLEAKSNLYVGSRGMPALPEVPGYELEDYEPDQRYLTELWSEKNTMNRFLKQLASRYGLVLQTGKGQASISMAHNLVRRALKYQKPARALYICDYDHSGMTMPVAAARHIEHYLYTHGITDVDITLEHIIMTPALIEKYSLPIAPIEEDDTRGQNFKRDHGAEGTTELDALEELYPGEFSRVVEQAIQRYYDVNLTMSVYDARQKLEGDLQQRREVVRLRHADEIAATQREHDEIEADIEERMAAYKEHVDDLWVMMKEELEEDMPDLDDYPIPEGKEVKNDDCLFSSLRDEDEQFAAYKKFQGKEAHNIDKRSGVGITGEVGTVTVGNHNSKLTVEQKMEIRKLYATGTHTHEQLAQMYGVSQPTIYRVLAAIGK